jgi:hypothetical protein
MKWTHVFIEIITINQEILSFFSKDSMKVLHKYPILPFLLTKVSSQKKYLLGASRKFDIHLSLLPWKW